MSDHGAVRLTALGYSDPRRAISGGGVRPCGMGLRAKAAKGETGDQVSLEVESVLDGGVGDEESLGRSVALKSCCCRWHAATVANVLRLASDLATPA
jgi:hypothetical protein